jgi:FkbM family methyltransferase
MTVVYPFSTIDQDLALKNARWINELGGCKGHHCQVIFDKRCAPELVESILVELRKAFDNVEITPADGEVDGWPEGANYFFRVVTATLQHRPGCPYFMWMEPDAIPLKPGWLDTLEAEYRRAGKPFMGDRVEVEDIPLHMSGVGIYQNPIYLLAGEAYRAFDTAFDMAAKDQIVPNAYFTKLIEHAWKHPKFTSIAELRTQIAPETILFHSSKDGSLIDLLRQKAAPETNHHSVPTEPTTTPRVSREEIGTRAVQPVYDIFIRTYSPDYDWLHYCVQSIDKFCRGFRKVWLVSPSNPPVWMLERTKAHPGVEIDWKIMNDESPDGYLAQQITKLYADVVTDYQPDYILHVDSDVIFTRPVTPDIFFSGGELMWYYTPFEAIETPWKPIVEKFIRQPVAYEFMRSMPFMVPRWLYPKIREYCHATHGMIISDYIRTQPQRAFSEFNIMGAYAYRNHTKAFKWINTLDQMPQHLARQFRSWDGITGETKKEIETILGSGELDVPSAPSEAAEVNAAPQSPIKVLKDLDVWVLEGDQISGWVEQEGRLDHDQNLLPDILPHINEGDTVIDVGAFIGDHTVAYARKAAIVLAFEPNPMAFQCLKHNMSGLDNVTIFETALGNGKTRAPLSGNNGNYGGAYLGDHMKISDVDVAPLDEYNFSKVNLIKIDVEGCEIKVLNGAEKTINTHRPKMVIEVNSEALARQDAKPDDIYEWLEEHQYRASIMQKNCGLGSPMYDILCLPKQPPEKSQDEMPLSPAPVAAPLTVKEEIASLVNRLKEISETSIPTKSIVMQRLVHAGLRQKRKGKH